jgi:hypothetical protein
MWGRHKAGSLKLVMLERMLLDANAVLNATFIAGSWSALVVSKLVARKCAIFVGSRSLAEAVFIARKTATELGKRTDPAEPIEAFIRIVGAVQVPPAIDNVEDDIPEHDRHVVQEAITANAAILTSDAELWTVCAKVGRDAVFPLEALRRLDGMTLATTVFGVPPGRDTGSVFARVYPGGWGGMQNVGEFTVADFFGRLWLRYSTTRSAWTVELDEVGAVSVAAPTAQNVMQVVAVSWQATKALQLRIAAVEAPGTRPMPKPLSASLAGNVSIGHRADGSHHWNGVINACVMNDRPIGKSLWTNLRGSAVLTPNPYDSDRLRQAMNRAIT